MDLLNSLNNLLPSSNIDQTPQVTREDGQVGIFELLQAQTAWVAKVGIIPPDKVQSESR